MSKDNRIKEIRQIALLRHELHHSNIALDGTLRVMMDKLHTFKDNFGISNKMMSEAINDISNDAETALSYSMLFANTIENIFATFNEDQPALFNVNRCNVYKIIQDVQHVLAHQANDKRLDFQNNFSKPVNHFIEGDKGQLVRVFMNLYFNAIKYSFLATENRRRYIRTNITSFEDKLKVSIENYGIGILKEEIPHMFQKGYRGMLSADKHRTGSGIGLFQVKKIIEAHHGEVSISSTNRSNDIYNGVYLTEISILLPYFQKIKSVVP